MYAQCDPDGHTYVLFDSRTNFRRSTTTLCYADQTVRKADGCTFLRRSTAGWKFCVQWKYVSTSWGVLLYLKKLHTLETAEYSVSQSLEHKPTSICPETSCAHYLSRQIEECALSEMQSEVWNYSVQNCGGGADA